MAPLAQRLRLHQSVEVDEEDPDFIRGKRNAELVLKNSLDAIIAKYSNMPDYMSDEVDIVTGTVAIDRGHLRSRPDADKELHYVEEIMMREDVPEDDWDELAPPELRRAKDKDTNQDGHVQDSPQVNERVAAKANESSIAQTPHQIQASSPVAVAPVAVPNTPIPQSVLTPEARSALINSINQDIARFVTDRVAGALSLLENSVGSSTNTSPILHSVRQPVATPAHDDTVQPGTDPNWWFPPLSRDVSGPSLAQSSPVVATNSERKRRESFTAAVHGRPVKRRANSKGIETDLLQTRSENLTETISPTSFWRNANVGSPVANSSRPILSRNGTRRKKYNSKYNFSSEDDEYIIEQKEIYGVTWQMIKDGRPGWEDWPLYALITHYHNCLKIRGQNESSMLDTEVGHVEASTAEDEAVPLANTAMEVCDTDPRIATSDASQRQSHRLAKSRARAKPQSPQSERHGLLTPKSNEPSKKQWDTRSARVDVIAGLDDEEVDNETHSDPTFEPEESEHEGRPEDCETVELNVFQEDVVLTSIEQDPSIPEDAHHIRISGKTSELPPTPASSSNNKRTRHKPSPHNEKIRTSLRSRVIADSEDEVTITASETPQRTDSPPLRNRPRNRQRIPQSPSMSQRADTVANDELDPSSPAPIEDENRCAEPVSLLLQTPQPHRERSQLPSSTSKSTSKIERIRLRNTIKAEWAKNKRVRTPQQKMQALKARRSMQDMKKRLQDDGSEDDLA